VALTGDLHALAHLEGGIEFGHGQLGAVLGERADVRGRLPCHDPQATVQCHTNAGLGMQGQVRAATTGGDLGVNQGVRPSGVQTGQVHFQVPQVVE
jgi:hypothetical protein